MRSTKSPRMVLSISQIAPESRVTVGDDELRTLNALTKNMILFRRVDISRFTFDVPLNSCLHFKVDLEFDIETFLVSSGCNR